MQVKKVAVELFTEKRESDHMELIMNNALALALNSRSSECVQVVLDAAATGKVRMGFGVVVKQFLTPKTSRRQGCTFCLY
jgi:hypothetical protein